jgi:hypothetical protein
MAGNTATIDVVAFRSDWGSYMPIAALCDRYAITKDQVIGLRKRWQLPLRVDRRLRFKPKRSDMVDPSPAQISVRAAAIRATWDEHTERLRRVGKPQPYTAPIVSVTGQAASALGSIAPEGEP